MDISRLAMLAISDTGFVFDPRTGHSYTANATGMAILNHLKKGRPIPEVLARIEETFEAPASLPLDLEAFVEALSNYDLISSSRSFSEAQ